MITLLVAVPSSYGDWDKFQSVLDSVQELYDIQWLVYSKPHKLISLYCKIDLVQCGIHSLEEHDKYDMALVFSNAKEKMINTINELQSYNKTIIVYDSAQDEIEVIQ